MKVWTNNEFEGHYPVGTAAVVIAPTPEAAAAYLNEYLPSCGLQPSAKPDQFEELPLEKGTVAVLNNGDY